MAYRKEPSCAMINAWDSDNLVWHEGTPCKNVGDEREVFSMKKLVSMSLALLLALSVLSIPVMAETESSEGGAVGYLSFLSEL